MKSLIFATIVLIAGYLEKNSIQNNSHEMPDRHSGNGLSKSTKKEIVIDFPLDSLLKFDSEKALKKVFGTNVKRSTGYYPEGMGEYANTLLFPETKNEVEFVWEDDSINFCKLAYISIKGQQTDWKTKEGITIGTSLKELEKFNKKPFKFYGFDWDYSGLTSWENGYLDQRKVFVNLDFPPNATSNDIEALTGDREFKSNSKLAQKVNPIVREIIMRR